MHLIIYYICILILLCYNIVTLYKKRKKEGGFSMRDLKTYLSVAPVLSTLWFGSLAGLLIEINRFFPDALTFPFFSF
uniref:photosystem I subunit IX n=1 Tax=Oxyria digyna TaxID=284366 RepID=UPI002869F3CF|nr:photosystem I subunit IX [Oxyria digyna]WLS51274.1 photosystem I subunit IX [Oxyria digyna]